MLFADASIIILRQPKLLIQLLQIQHQNMLRQYIIKNMVISQFRTVLLKIYTLKKEVVVQSELKIYRTLKLIIVRLLIQHPIKMVVQYSLTLYNLEF